MDSRSGVGSSGDPQRMQQSGNGASAIYPGSFDPLTRGHLDLIARGARLFDRLIVAVLTNTQKMPLFSVEERVSMVRETVSSFRNVEVASFGGLLVEYAATRKVNVILRGIRSIGDSEIEMQIANLNRRMEPAIETVCLFASEEFAAVSSRMVKEIFTLGGDITAFVPDAVARRLQAKR